MVVSAVVGVRCPVGIGLRYDQHLSVVVCLREVRSSPFWFCPIFVSPRRTNARKVPFFPPQNMPRAHGKRQIFNVTGQLTRTLIARRAMHIKPLFWQALESFPLT